MPKNEEEILEKPEEKACHEEIAVSHDEKG
jgi:hypothetical protein